jgi:hypothetical protein
MLAGVGVVVESSDSVGSIPLKKRLGSDISRLSGAMHSNSLTHVEELGLPKWFGVERLQVCFAGSIPSLSGYTYKQLMGLGHALKELAGAFSIHGGSDHRFQDRFAEVVSLREVWAITEEELGWRNTCR